MAINTQEIKYEDEKHQQKNENHRKRMEILELENIEIKIKNTVDLTRDSIQLRIYY